MGILPSVKLKNFLGGSYKMKKMLMNYFFAIPLLIGLLGPIQVLAASQGNELNQSSEVHGHGHGHFRHNPEFLKNQAEALGIKTDGKDTETIDKEVREAMMKKRAETLGISTKGKDLDSLAK